MASKHQAAGNQATGNQATGDRPAKPADSVLRIPAALFTRLGLLTPQEIANRTPVSRIISIEDSENPLAGSMTRYEDACSPNGMRTEYNLAAAGQRDAAAVVPELTVSASISRTLGFETRGWLFPRQARVEPTTHFTLVASQRLRDGTYKTMTQHYLTVGTQQDPGDTDSFLVEFVDQDPPDLPGLFRQGGMAAVVNDLKMRRQGAPYIVGVMGSVVEKVAADFEKLRDNPDVVKTTVRLGSGPG